ncbi:MAG TPA: hypothetical protein DEA95_00330 [Nitrospiraceae bacterium]|nr:hypothetical protein [Nitrospiraceae bacterium]
MDGGGVLITEVTQKGTKTGEDVQVRDIIIEANGNRINSTEEFAIIIKGMKSGERLLTLLKHGNS